MLAEEGKRKNSYDEGVYQNFEDFLFVFNMIDMLGIDDFLFFHSLNSVLFLRLIFEPTYSHVSEGAYNLVVGGLKFDDCDTYLLRVSRQIHSLRA